MQEIFLELIRRASSILPDDVVVALKEAAQEEQSDGSAYSAILDILHNCKTAKDSSRPLCQDTGQNIWYVYLPRIADKKEVSKSIVSATRKAVELSYLRPNAVDSITGINSKDNTGLGMPQIHFTEWDNDYLSADLMLKGGGCENVSLQLSLPDTAINAGRDLDGVRRAVIEGVFRAQGKGCAPGIIGVCVGGDRATSMTAAKEQLFRKLYDKNSNPVLKSLEERLYKECNELGIGPMGFGGKTTVLGVKICTLHRLPASFFVSIAYMCWACRRMSVEMRNDGISFSEDCITARSEFLERLF